MAFLGLQRRHSFGGWLPKAQTWILRIGEETNDSEEAQLRKTLLVLTSLATIVAGLLWSLLYWTFAEPLAAAIPLGYAVGCGLNILAFTVTRRYALFACIQLSLILLLPWLLMIVLGGFINSSAIVLWSILGPIGALLFLEPRQARLCFLAYGIFVILGGLLEPYLRTTNNLPPLIVTLFFVLNIVGVSAIVFGLLVFFINQRNVLQTQSDALLLNILPRDIAAILRKENRVIADHYDEVSILFADIVDFTTLAARLSPPEVIGLLNEVFSHFDTLVESYGVEKIKTVGDCYMVAAGIPRPRPDHAQTLTRLALEMQDYINSRVFAGAHRLELRIGLHSGPVMAGVIGRKKFIYDLWGDVVNTASRMESQGRGGRIQITAATYELVKDDFVCVPRGKVMVKGKGEMDTWFIMRPHGE